MNQLSVHINEKVTDSEHHVVEKTIVVEDKNRNSITFVLSLDANVVSFPNWEDWEIECRMPTQEWASDKFQEIKDAITNHFKGNVTFERFAPSVDAYKIQTPTLTTFLSRHRKSEMAGFIFEVLSLGRHLGIFQCRVHTVLRGDSAYVGKSICVGFSALVPVPFNPGDLFLTQASEKGIRQYFDTEHAWRCTVKSLINAEDVASLVRIYKEMS